MRKRRGKKNTFLLPAVVVTVVGMLLILVAVLRFSPSRILLFFESDPPQLPMPIAGVAPAQLADSFGASRSGRRHHAGIDIFAKRGSAVLSTTKGVVLLVGENRLGGHTVWVLGPGCRRHYYAHLERYGDVKRGQRIEAGHFIGTVGTSGNAKGTPPHLHYGIYDLFGAAIDPYPLLRRRAELKTASSAALP